MIRNLVSLSARFPGLYKQIRFWLNGININEDLFSRIVCSENSSILDIGCGTGISQALYPKGTLYIGIDPDPILLSHAKKHNPKGNFLSANAERIPLATKSIDQAMVVNVFHHLNENQVRLFLAELKRVLRGTLYIVDADPARSNRFQKFLLSLDPGIYPLSLEDRLSQITPYFKIIDTKPSQTPTGSVCLYTIQAQ